MDQSNPVPTPPPAPAPLPQQPTAPSTPTAPSGSKGLAITALVLGIIAFLFGWLGLLSIFGAGNIVTALAAIVVGAIALVKKQPKGFALTGVILGVLGLITTVLLIIVTTIASYSAIQQKAKENADNSTSSSSSFSTTWDADAAYAKITNGMSKAEVEAATGKSSESCSESVSEYGKYETCNYGNYSDDKTVISVSYTDNKVTTKSKY